MEFLWNKHAPRLEWFEKKSLNFQSAKWLCWWISCELQLLLSYHEFRRFFKLCTHFFFTWLFCLLIPNLYSFLFPNSKIKAFLLTSFWFFFIFQMYFLYFLKLFTKLYQVKITNETKHFMSVSLECNFCWCYYCI